MSILVMGGDERMIYSARELSADTLFLGEQTDTNKKYDTIVLPMPLSRDGENVACPIEKTQFPFSKITEYAAENARIFAGGNALMLSEICLDKGYTLENYFASETLTLKNAKLTAEAAVMLLIRHSPSSLLGSTVLITGYGRIARFLARELVPFGCDIIIAARKSEARVLAELDGFYAVEISGIPDIIGECDYIANTAPAPLFSESDFAKMKEWTIFEELATLPQEPTRSLVEKYGGKYVFAGGLPGKISPEAAGKFIAEEINTLIHDS